jgi:hypothetical protein
LEVNLEEAIDGIFVSTIYFIKAYQNGILKIEKSSYSLSVRPFSNLLDF